MTTPWTLRDALRTEADRSIAAALRARGFSPGYYSGGPDLDWGPGAAPVEPMRRWDSTLNASVHYWSNGDTEESVVVQRGTGLWHYRPDWSTTARVAGRGADHLVQAILRAGAARRRAARAARA